MTESGLLTEAISQVGKGVTKAKHLSESQATHVMQVMLSGRADPLELGALLIALRIKEETADELTAFVRVAQTCLPPPAYTPDLTIASYAGKRQTFPALLPAACVMAACGVSVGLHGHATPPQRRSLARVWQTLGGVMNDPAADLERVQVAYADIETLMPTMHQMLELRQQMGLRTCFHTMARLINPFGAARQMVGISHARTFEKFAAASHQLGYQRVVAFRGMEGEAEPNPLTATHLMTLQADGIITETPLNPQQLGIAKASRQPLMVENDAEAAQMVRDSLTGQGAELVTDAVALTAAIGLWTAERVTTVAEGLSSARIALSDGSANDRLQRWLQPAI